MHVSQTLLITGGAGFIGSNFIRYLCSQDDCPESLVILDKLTYAGNLENLAGLENRFAFVHGDINDAKRLAEVFQEHPIDSVIHFAAESHVDRSILGPLVFTRTNVLGTHTLAAASLEHGVKRFLHISTDEVYGSIDPGGLFTEDSTLNPTSPYAASKASSDLIIQAYWKTYGLPAIITRCSNNYGPYQFPEKLLPLMITNAIRDMKLPVYGDGRNVRDWIHTLDHSRAIHAVLRTGMPGEIYNIGGGNEWTNLDIIRLILRILDKPEALIDFVKDRPAHDRRYAIDATKIQTRLGWNPTIPFEEGIRRTVEWYLENESWWRRVMSGEYQEYYQTQYLQR